MIKKIDHINICVTNLEESKKFFTDLLGFTLINEDLLEGEWIDKVTGISGVKAKFAKIALPGTETNIELIQYYSPKGKTDSPINMPNQNGFRHMAFEVDNMEVLYQKLLSAGIVFFSEIQYTPRQKKLCYFSGPDNIILELAEYML